MATGLKTVLSPTEGTLTPVANVAVAVTIDLWRFRFVIISPTVSSTRRIFVN